MFIKTDHYFLQTITVKRTFITGKSIRKMIEKNETVFVFVFVDLMKNQPTAIKDR